MTAFESTPASAERTPRRIGVEEELLLVDPTTGQPVPVAARIIAEQVAAAGLPRDVLLEHEVKHEQIEAVSPPVETFEEVFECIVAGRRRADIAAGHHGARAVASASSPLACTPHPVSLVRYDSMRERFGSTFDEQLTCGYHVHVEVRSADEGVAVLDRIRPWLPLLLALSANSPFWQGHDTQYASYRYQAWGRWPSAGPYEIAGSPEAYAESVRELLETDVPLDAGMIYFDARLSNHAPTVETRIADVCRRPEDAAALAVLIRALVETAASEWRLGTPPDPVSTAVLRAASWRASRYGTTGMLLSPLSRTLVPAGVALAQLLGHVAAAFTTRTEADLVALQVSEILRRGTGSREQREAASVTGSLKDALSPVSPLDLSAWGLS
jgi:carboxylate-amine ligase